MRTNRRRSKRLSVITSTMLHFGAVFSTLFVVVILHVMASSSCNQLLTLIGTEEKQLEKLKDECRQESTRWEQMKTPDRLESALLRHGLSMKVPRPDQNVYMKADGKPYPGQLSVSAAKRRNGMTAAQNVYGVKRHR